MAYDASHLSHENILRDVHDPVNQTLRTTATAVIGSVVVDVDYTSDSVAVGDPITNNTLKINANGSVDANVVVSHTEDSIKIGDGTDLLAVNADGSINVEQRDLTFAQDKVDVSGSTVQLLETGNITNAYNEISAVAASTLSTILTYNITTGTKLLKIDASGENVAEFTVVINSIVVSKKRTYFGNSLNVTFDFERGLELVATDIVQVKVYHTRPSLSNFNANIVMLEA